MLGFEIEQPIDRSQTVQPSADVQGQEGLTRRPLRAGKQFVGPGMGLVQAGVDSRKQTLCLALVLLILGPPGYPELRMSVRGVGPSCCRVFDDLYAQPVEGADYGLDLPRAVLS